MWPVRNSDTRVRPRGEEGESRQQSKVGAREKRTEEEEEEKRSSNRGIEIGDESCREDDIRLQITLDRIKSRRGLFSNFISRRPRYTLFWPSPLRCVQQALCWHVARGRGVCLEKGAGRGRRDKPSAHCRAAGGRQYGQSRMKESVIVSFSSLPPSSSGGREGC